MRSASRENIKDNTGQVCSQVSVRSASRENIKDNTGQVCSQVLVRSASRENIKDNTGQVRCDWFPGLGEETSRIIKDR